MKLSFTAENFLLQLSFGTTVRLYYAIFEKSVFQIKQTRLQSTQKVIAKTHVLLKENDKVSYQM